MPVVESIPDGSKVFIDSNVLVYAFLELANFEQLYRNASELLSRGRKGYLSFTTESTS